MNHGRQSRIRRGHTLLELVISVPLMTLLMLGMAASIHLAARALPDGSSRASATIFAGAAIDQIASELTFATSITSRTAIDILFVTPDRDGDSSAETVRYQWSGTAGAPLTRQVNGSASETLVPSVQDFGLTYETRLDTGTGLQYLQAVNVRLVAPAGTSARTDARLKMHNEPLFP
jgi:hypothetical protein